MIEKQLIEDRTIYLIIKSRKNYLSDKLLAIHTTEESAIAAMPATKKKLFVRPVSIQPAAISHCLISLSTLKEISLDYTRRYQRLLSFNDFINNNLENTMNTNTQKAVYSPAQVNPHFAKGRPVAKPCNTNIRHYVLSGSFTAHKCNGTRFG